MSPKPHTRDKQIAIFWSKVQKSENTNDCWLWQGAVLQGKGYGRAFLGSGREHIGAHRVSYILAHGEIPDGLYVCHHCDTPRCVNPRHLYAGTAKQNSADVFRRNRRKIMRGSEHPNARLTPEQVLRIRKLVASGMKQRIVGEMFGLHQAGVSKIVRRIQWRCI